MKVLSKYVIICDQLFVFLHSEKTPPHNKPCLAKPIFAYPYGLIVQMGRIRNINSFFNKILIQFFRELLMDPTFLIIILNGHGHFN